MTRLVKEYRALDTDATLSADSNYRISSQKAVKSYIDTEVSHVKGAIDWRMQNYTVPATGKTLTITLDRPCYILASVRAAPLPKESFPSELSTATSPAVRELQMIWSSSPAPRPP